MQEQQSQINELKEQLSACCATSEENKSMQQQNTQPQFAPQHMQDVTLRAKAKTILYQNTPNPAVNGYTEIRYYLPEEVMSAEMHFYDSYGKVVEVVQLTPSTGSGTTGMGQLNVDAQQLAKGVYTYSLVVDGSVVDTRKMVRE